MVMSIVIPYEIQNQSVTYEFSMSKGHNSSKTSLDQNEIQTPPITSYDITIYRKSNQYLKAFKTKSGKLKCDGQTECKTIVPFGIS